MSLGARVRIGCSRAVVLGSLALALCGACTRGPELAPFTTDRCSAFFDGPPWDGERWAACCVAHDVAYWRGGTREERAASDRALRQCVASSGSPWMAPVIEWSVYVGGGPYVPAPWRWSYGWRYTRGYRAVTPEEKTNACELLRSSIPALRPEDAAFLGEDPCALLP